MAGQGVERARGLRQRMTPWERLLWRHLRGHRAGFHFRRQHPFGPYVLDFYCSEARLCVEIDGEGHALFHATCDAERDLFLESYGILTFRLTNTEVGANTMECVERIMKLCGDLCGSG